MNVGDIMTKKVITVSPETKLTEVADIMFRNRFHGIPVTEDGKVAGIITESDFFTRDPSNTFLPSYINFLSSINMADKLSGNQKEKLSKLIEATAADIMNRDCVTIKADMNLTDLMEFFKKTKFITLPVTDEEKRLLGIVTLADIIGLVKIQQFE